MLSQEQGPERLELALPAAGPAVPPVVGPASPVPPGAWRLYLAPELEKPEPLELERPGRRQLALELPPLHQRYSLAKQPPKSLVHWESCEISQNNNKQRGSELTKGMTLT